MPKIKTVKPPAAWKKFRLADGTTRYLPEWADKPLKFDFDPDEALRTALTVKPPKNWNKVITTGRKSRR